MTKSTFGGFVKLTRIMDSLLWIVRHRRAITSYGKDMKRFQDMIIGKTRSLLLLVLGGVCFLGAGGCGPMRFNQEVAGESVFFGYSAESRPIEGELFGKGEDVIFILAAIHGNEQAGTRLVASLSDYLCRHPRLLGGRCVVLMPVANPDGVERNSRGNSYGVDLNRNFATANHVQSARHGEEPLSEPETRIIAAVIRQWQPDRILSIHQPLNCLDYDGQSEALAEHLAGYGPLPLKKLGSLPGSLGSYAAERNIPIITLELPRAADQEDSDALWNTYGGYLRAAITYPDVAE
ncbi:MAG: murein peptide amidase A [Planctomycetes bacterium ADurb.Bin412]|nr:MAG: murein peptide amidase A [Planctomycetes bacterium ADurb.Bin412]